MRPKHYDVALFFKSYSKTKSTAMPRQELELLLNFRVIYSTISQYPVLLLPTLFRTPNFCSFVILLVTETR